MSQSPGTKEPQYSLLYDVKEKHGVARLGLMINESWNQDPKRTLFTLARYKFVARMLSGRKHVLEVGCADALVPVSYNRESARSLRSISIHYLSTTSRSG